MLRNSDPGRFSILFPLLDAKNSALVTGLKQAADQPISAAANEDAKDEIATRRAQAAVALLRLGETSAVLHLLEFSPDPRSRSAFITALGPLGANPRVLVDELEKVVKSTAMVAVEKTAKAQTKTRIFSIPRNRDVGGDPLVQATYPPAEFEPESRKKLIDLVQVLYRNDADAGIHSAAELVLGRGLAG